MTFGGMQLLFVAISSFPENAVIQLIWLWKPQALAQTLKSVLHMDNRAGTSFLRPSALRFGLSEGFSED